MGSNCVVSTSIGCLFCCKGCNAEKVRNGFTFIPPPSSYSIEVDPEDAEKRKGRVMYRMQGLQNSGLYNAAAEMSEARFLTTRKGCLVPIVWFRKDPVHKASSSNAVPDAPPSAPMEVEEAERLEHPLVLLHCHGNATDIGMMMGPYYELSKVCGIEVVGVEYSGYGAASGKPSSAKTLADVEAAYDFLIESGVPSNRIVAYGQSVGSGVVTHLAAKRPIGGLILHSPLLSGIKVVDPRPDNCCRPSCVWRCFDFYQNDQEVKQLSCPAFIMHGKRDDIIPFYHGYRLHQTCPKEQRWPAYFPARAGHNDLVECDMRTYYREVGSFLNDVRRKANGEVVNPPECQAIAPQQVGMFPKAQVISTAGFVDPVRERNICSDESLPGIEPTPSMGPCESIGPTMSMRSESASQPRLTRVQLHQPITPTLEDDAPDVSLLASRSGALQSAEEFLGLGRISEPKVGPEDGRYGQMRQGNLWVPGGLGAENSAAPDADQRELEMLARDEEEECSEKLA